MLARARLVDPVEALEDPLAMRGRNPGTLIDDVDPADRRVTADDHPDAAAFGAVLDCVVHDVHERLPKDEAICLHRHRFASFDGQ